MENVTLVVSELDGLIRMHEDDPTVGMWQLLHDLAECYSQKLWDLVDWPDGGAELLALVGEIRALPAPDAEGNFPDE